MPGKFLAILLMTSAVACCPEAKAAQGQQLLVEKRSDEQSISLVRLMAVPENFDGKYVVVQGYLVLSDDYEHSLFLDENAYRVGLSANSVAVDFQGSAPQIRDRSSDLDRRYVIVAGRFAAGPTAFSGGVIQEVYRIFTTVNVNE